MLFDKLYGIDLGTNTIKIYNQKKDRFLIEKNMIAIRDMQSVFAIGDAAYEMYERSPENMQVVVPMANGRISDVLLVEAILHTLLARCSKNLGYRPTLFFTVPTNTTEIEKRAYYSIAHRGKLKRCRVFLVEKPIADALALGIPINRTKGSMIVNIGAQSTEMSILADQRIIISRTVPIGGNQLDSSIVAAVRRLNNFQISTRTAMNLKIRLADFTGNRNAQLLVDGIDVDTGLPCSRPVTSYSITVTLQEQMILIAEEIRKFLDRTPPQVRNAIAEEGIYLTGGTTCLEGMGDYFQNYLNCKCQVSKLHERSTIEGLKELINHPVLHKWAFVTKKQRY